MTLRMTHLTVWDGADRVIADATIDLQDGRIRWMGPTSEAPPPAEGTQVQDAQGKLALPGLVNAHTHLYSSLARGMAVSPFEPTSFTQILEQLWWRLDKALDPASVRASAQIGAMEAARCGVTTLIDHHASPFAIPGSLDAVEAAVVDELGLRGAFCYELSDRDGIDKRDEGIAENVRFLSRPGSARSAGLFGLHASFTVSDQTLEQVAQVIPDDVGIHIHVAEGPEDEVQCVQSHGVRIVHRLDRFGLLRPRSILAHCLHIDDEEKALLAERGVIVVHNPRSNMNNGVGCFDLEGFLARGIVTGLGTDGLGANMLAELFTAGILQKHAAGDPLKGGFDQLTALLFVHNPTIARRLLGIDVGRIAIGGPADVVLLDYTPPTALDENTVLGHLLFGAAVHTVRVTDSFVAGRPVLRDGAFVDVDEEAVYAHAREQASALWRRLDSGVIPS